MQCRHSHRSETTAIVAARRQIEKFSRGSRVAVDGDDLVLHLGSESHVLAPEEARRLRSALGDALTRRDEFVHTTGERREDGSYVVARRGADSSGHRKVFESFPRVEELYRHLPTEFTAADVGRSGLTGGRRHALLWHFVEHPAFDCDLTCRQPLTARKHP